jgi:hypothetical protein
VKHLVRVGHLYKYMTKEEVSDSDIRACLLSYKIKYARKNVCSTGRLKESIKCLCNKTFFFVNDAEEK